MIQNATRSAMVTALTDLLDGGHVEIRTGSGPADPDDAATGTLLADIPLATPAFGAPTNGVALADAAAAETTGITDGTAGWYRAYSSADVPVIDGSSDMTLTTSSITTGSPVGIISWSVTMPDGS